MVTCKGCGFLGVKRKDSDELTCVPIELRNGGTFPMQWGDRGEELVYRKQFFCLKEMADFAEEIRQSLGDDWESRAQNAISKERKCGNYIAFQTGHTPKEHSEMRLLEEQGIQALAWQRKVEESIERRHRETRADVVRAIKEGRRTARWGVFWSLVSSIIVAIFGAALAARLGTYDRKEPIKLDQLIPPASSEPTPSS